MAQVNTTISDKLHQRLEEISELTGLSKSSLIAEYVRRGIYQDALNEAKLAEYMTKIQGRKSQEKTEERGNEGA